LVLRSNVDGHIHMRAYLSRETIITSFSLARVSIRTGSAVKLDNFQFHHYIRLHDLKFHIRCLSLCTSPSSTIDRQTNTASSDGWRDILWLQSDVTFSWAPRASHISCLFIDLNFALAKAPSSLITMIQDPTRALLDSEGKIHRSELEVVEGEGRPD